VVSAPAPLEGVTVLDLSTVGPGTRCTRILADYGARVVKVGVPPKKSGLQVQPAFWSYSASRGMQQVRIDLKDADGKAAFLALVKSADVVLESFRPGVIARLGFGYDDLCKVNPRIILCSTSGYGQDGPASQWAGHDINYLAVGGYLHTSGRRGDGAPPLPGATVADSAAGGMHAAIAIMAALMRREKTGEGEVLDVCVAEGVLQLTSLYIDQFLATGEKPAPGHDILTGRYACYATYTCGDGGHVAVGAIEPHFYANLCKRLGCEQWLAHQTDDAVQEKIRADFAAAFASRSRDAWVAELAANDTCVTPVYAIEELVEDAQFQARGAFVEAEHPTEGRFRQVAPPLAGMPRGEEPIAVPDTAKTDTDALLAEAGVSRETIEKMRSTGVVA
jgi:alpha-methylacyl-CoA racemase